MKVIILTSFRHNLASLCVPELIKNNIEIVKIVFNENTQVNKNKLRKRKLAKVKKIGLLGALNGLKMRKWYTQEINKKMCAPNIEEVASHYNIPFHTVQGINTIQTINLFKEAQSDIGISLGNGYIESKVFQTPKFGMINIHHELLPEYPGGQSVIWPIFFGKKYTGYTIHQVDRKIDNGKILLKEKMEIGFQSTLRSTIIENYFKVKMSSIKGLVQVLLNYENLANSALIQQTQHHFTTPTILQFFRIMKNHKKLKKNI